MDQICPLPWCCRPVPRALSSRLPAGTHSGCTIVAATISFLALDSLKGLRPAVRKAGRPHESGVLTALRAVNSIEPQSCSLIDSSRPRRAQGTSLPQGITGAKRQFLPISTFCLLIWKPVDLVTLSGRGQIVVFRPGVYAEGERCRRMVVCLQHQGWF